jgi:hypothetical protein
MCKPFLHVKNFTQCENKINWSHVLDMIKKSHEIYNNNNYYFHDFNLDISLGNF